MYIILQNVHCVNTYAKIGKNHAENGIFPLVENGNYNR